jgi:hypothetical protein
LACACVPYYLAACAQQGVLCVQQHVWCQPHTRLVCAAELTPPRAARPKTTTAVARRLISNALGNSQVRH